MFALLCLLYCRNAKLSGPIVIVSEPWVGSGHSASSRMQAVPGAGDEVGVVGRGTWRHGNAEEAWTAVNMGGYLHESCEMRELHCG